MTNVFDPHIHFKQVVIVGVGGTGCQVVRIAARMLYDMRRSRMHAPQMVLIDPDRIEEKNVGRQGYMLNGIWSEVCDICSRVYRSGVEDG
jgi:tRNA A37 threonylcarbamoyladenosine dehydratase